MTVQIEDKFRYRGIEYSVNQISDPIDRFRRDELFDPAVLELSPKAGSTDCWRGYRPFYGIVDKHLVVEDLHVCLFEEGEGYKRKLGPTLNGIAPTEKP